MVRGILADTDHKAEFNSIVEQIKEEDGDTKPAAKKTSINITVLPTIRVMNATADGTPVLPLISMETSLTSTLRLEVPTNTTLSLS